MGTKLPINDWYWNDNIFVFGYAGVYHFQIKMCHPILLKKCLVLNKNY
jgi:hypothetical protein